MIFTVGMVEIMQHAHKYRLQIKVVRLARTTLWLAMSVTAQAASFNCSKAVSPQEKAICANPELSHADEELSAAYKAALHKVSDNAQGEMRADQTGWLKWLATVCRAQTPQAARILAKCMIGPYGERTETLQKSVVLKGPMLFYTRTTYLATPDVLRDDDTTGAQFKGFGVLQMKWPQADVPRQTPGQNPDQRWAAWNAAVQTTVIQYAGDGKKTTLSPDMAEGGDTDLTAKVESVTDSRASTTIELDTMGHGAAHPNESSKTFHWLLKQNRALAAQDVFRPDTAWKQALAQRCWTALNEQVPEGDLFIKSSHDKELLDVVGNIENWTITKAGLSIDFPEYSVTPRSSPVEPIVVPWTALKSYTVATFDPAS
jgi:uncharacterized protein YecT (DUF1311 family)